MRIGYFGPWYGSRVHPMVAFQLLADGQEIALEEDIELIPFWADILGVDDARNTAVEWARAEGFDWLVMQDADVWAEGVRPILELVRLGEETKAAVVAAACPLRRKSRKLSVVPEPKNADPYEAELAGTGMMAIRVSALDGIADQYDGPWFARTYKDKRQTEVQTTGDMWFTRLIGLAGLRLIVHAGIPTAHDCRIPLVYKPGPRGETSGASKPDGVETE